MDTVIERTLVMVLVLMSAGIAALALLGVIR